MPKINKRQVLFTGFDATTKKALINRARESGFHVPHNVTKKLGLLVCGPNAGKMKLKRSMEQGVEIVQGTRKLNRLLHKPNIKNLFSD